MTSLFNRLTGKAVSRTAFVEHLGQEVVQHHPNWKVMISTDHKLMRIDTGHQTVEITLDDAYNVIKPHQTRCKKWLQIC